MSDPSIIPEGLDAVLVLLRHGESEFIVEGRFQGQADSPLSAVGRRQAELAGARLAHAGDAPPLPIPAGRPLEIAHSPLGRTTETATAVAAAFGDLALLRPEPGLLEIAQGEWEGLSHAQVAARYRETLAGWRRRPTETWAPGGESLADVQSRVRPALAAALARLAAGRSPGTLDRPQVTGYRGADPDDRPWSILVGHDGVFKVALLTLLGLPLERFWMLTFGLTAINVVELRAGRPVLRALNLAEHLAPLAEAEARAEAEAAEREGSGAL